MSCSVHPGVFRAFRLTRLNLYGELSCGLRPCATALSPIEEIFEVTSAALCQIWVYRIDLVKGFSTVVQIPRTLLDISLHMAVLHEKRFRRLYRRDSTADSTQFGNAEMETRY